MKAAIFDLDGTLLDTLEDIAAAMNFALERHGLAPNPLEAYRRFVGEGVANLVARTVGPNAPKDLEAKVLQAYRARYEEAMAIHTRPYPGMVELLDALAQRRVPMAVLSNKPDGPTRALIDRFYPGKVASVRGERPSAPRKPDPAAALELAAELKAAPSDCAFIGDTRVDMETARRAGMPAVGVLWGFRDREELLSSGANFVAAHPHEILALF